MSDLSDLGIGEQVRRLNAARAAAKHARPGVGDPLVVLVELGRALREASKVFDDAGANRGRPAVPKLVLADFFREIGRTNVQFLELAAGMTQLPSPNTGDLLDPMSSGRYRDGARQVVNNARVCFEGVMDDIPLPLRLEWEALSLTATFHVRVSPIDPADIAREAVGPLVPAAQQLLVATEQGLVEGVADPEELLPWARFAAVRILMHHDPALAAPMLDMSAAELVDPHVRWQLVLAQLQVTAEQGDPSLVLQHFSDLVTEQFAASSVERLGRSVTATLPVLITAGRLIERGLLDDASAVLEDLSRLAGYAATNDPLLRVFEVNGKVHSILEFSGVRHLATAVADAQASMKLVKASADEDPDRTFRERKSLGRGLRPILGQEALEGVTSLTIDPVGFCSWWPWHAFATGQGVSFSEKVQLRWRHPRPRQGGLSPKQSSRVLVIDTSLPQAESIIRTFGRLLPDDSRIVRFNSEAGDVAARDLLQAMDSAGLCIYFGHAASDTFDASKSGLLVGPLQRSVSLDAISTANFHNLRSLVLVACEGGRTSPFLAGRSPAHAFAQAGVTDIVASLWTIWAKDGAAYLENLIKEMAKDSGVNLYEAWRTLAKKATPASTPFMMMR